MSTTVLAAGQNAALPARTVRVDVSAATNVTCLVLGASGSVSDDADVVFYNRPQAPGVQLKGNTLDLSLEALRAGAERVVIAARPASDSQAPSAAVTVISGGLEASFAPDVARTSTVLLLCEFYRRNGEWKARALGQGYSDGLTGLRRDFGVELADEPSGTSQAQPAPATFAPTANPAPAQDPTVAVPPPAPVSAPTSSTTGLDPARTPEPSHMTPAGWYPDPQNLAAVRWWDGRQWTGHVEAVQRVAAPSRAEHPAPAAHISDPTVPEAASRKVGFFGARGAAKDLAQENDQLRAVLQSVGGLDLAEIELRNSQARRVSEDLASQVETARRELEVLRAQTIDVRTAIDVSEFGLYDFAHPAEDSARLGAELSAIRVEIKNCVTAKRATTAVANFTFNNSAAKGRTFINDMSKMLLAAYNAEAENAIKTVRAGGLSTAQTRLEKAADRVATNGKMIALAITGEYHRLRMRELELAARHLAAVQAAREVERAHREELREAKRAEEELRREREKLDKEREHYANALAALEARGDDAGAAELRAKLAQIDQSIADVDYRAANVRAGYVYVISNLGSMGEHVVKIGMTRRLDPMDRVKELSDASVPFNFDVHALFFSEDAYGIEAMLHRHFADRRVNRINLRREFFYATPDQVLAALQQHKIAVVEYRMNADAEEYRASEALRHA
ncbi:MAG: DUF4041 domain-containing protein [Brevundimonas sp.]